MASEKWLIIGISGVTCGGKTTLSTELNKLLPNSKVISQDNYFWDVDHPNHTWISELNHINFDIITSLDMERMHSDISRVIKNRTVDHISTTNKSDLIQCTTLSNLQKLAYEKIKESNVKVLIIEGFCIFNYKPMVKLCNLKYYFTLTRDECYNRRIQRVYEPPDCPGYFEHCVWPEYLNLYKRVKEQVDDITYFDGTLKPPIDKVLSDICKLV